MHARNEDDGSKNWQSSVDVQLFYSKVNNNEIMHRDKFDIVLEIKIIPTH